MQLKFRESEPVIAQVGDVLYLDDITYAIVIDTSKKGFKYLNVTQPHILPVVPGDISYSQLKTIRVIGSLLSARLELLKAVSNTESRPIITDKTTLKDEYLGSIALNAKNEMLFISGANENGYGVLNLSKATRYFHNCKTFGDLYVLAKYSSYALHFDK